MDNEGIAVGDDFNPSAEPTPQLSISICILHFFVPLSTDENGGSG